MVARSRLYEFMIASLIFFFAMSAVPNFLMWQRKNADPEDWFLAKQIYVADYVVGEKPLFTYTRFIKQPFNATWDVEVQSLGDKTRETVCSGRGGGEYAPDETLPKDYDMNWFVGAKCVLIPGAYQIRATWYITVPNYPVMKYEAPSNIFKVLPKK